MSFMQDDEDGDMTKTGYYKIDFDANCDDKGTIIQEHKGS